jgi:hypothetical protein
MAGAVVHGGAARPCMAAMHDNVAKFQHAMSKHRDRE